MNPYIRVDDAEIDLIDLCKYLLHRIVWILLGGIVCAGFVGIYKFQSLKLAASDPEAVVQVESEYELSLEKYERQSELFVASDRNTLALIKKQEEYLNSSLLMQLDPYDVWTDEVIVRLVSEEQDFRAYQYEEIYKSELSKGNYLQELAKKRGTEAAYLKELITSDSIDERSVNNNSPSVSLVIPHEEESDNQVSSAVFVIKAYGNTEDEAQTLMDAVLEELQTKYKSYVKEHPHEMSVLSRDCSETVDTDLRQRQKDSVTYTQTLSYQMKDNTDKAALLSKPAESAAPAMGGISKKSLLKYGLAGFVGGIFLMCVWYALRYVLNDKLVDYKELERKGIILKDLGSIVGQDSAMSAANIRNFAGGKKKLFLTGMTILGEFDRVCDLLKKELSEFEIVYARDLLNDAKSRELLLDCDGVVLIEQKNLTSYSDMREEVTFLFNSGKEIIGIVIV